MVRKTSLRQLPVDLLVALKLRHRFSLVNFFGNTSLAEITLTVCACVDSKKRSDTNITENWYDFC